MKTGAELKARRLELGITQHDLAGNAGISRTQLSRMENGKIEIPSEIMEILCDLLYAKHEKPKLQFSDLEVGDYVYVRDDLVEFKEYGNNSYVNDLGAGHGCITNINNYQFEINNTGYYATPEMLDLSRSMKREDYLKMNDKEYTSFEELQYVANKALDESIIEKYEVCIGPYGNKMIIHFDGEFTEYSYNSTNSGIEFIQSLYNEEFVIETMADELRVKSGAELTLANGINCVYFDDGDRKLRYDDDFYPCNFLILKGATVKQHKGIK